MRAAPRPRLAASLALLLSSIACDRAPPPAAQGSAGASANGADAHGASAASSVNAPAASAASGEARPAASIDPARAARFMEDLNRFCIFTQEVKNDASIPREKRSVEILGRLIASKPSPEFLRTLRELGSAPSLYDALRQAAAERGASRWSCPALAD